MNRWQKYWFVAAISARSNLAYLGEVVARILFLGVILFIFLRLWQVTYSETGASRLGGLTLAQMIWYLTITEAFTLSTPLLSRDIDTDVREGVIAVQLLRPMNYGLYWMSRSLGERVVRFLINLLVGAALALMLVGPIDFSALSFIALLLALPMAFTLDFLASFMIGLGAFWLEDTGGLFLLYSRVRMILGGMLIPVELFPDNWQWIVRAMPFSSMVYGPAHLFVSPSLGELSELLMRQAAATVVFTGATMIIYRQAQTRLFANGG